MSSKEEASELAPDIQSSTPKEESEENEKLSSTEAFLLVLSLCVSSKTTYEVVF
jgi:hypothetical protein